MKQIKQTIRTAYRPELSSEGVRRGIVQLLLIFALLAFTSLDFARSSVASLQASVNPLQTGIELYEKGDFGAAVKIFKAVVKQDKTNVLGWHYLALAFEGLGKTSDARKAHEKAAKSGVALLTFQLANAYGPQYLESLRPLSSQLHFASASAKKYAQLSPNISKSKQWEVDERAELLRDFEQLSRGEDGEGLGKVIPSKEATTRARILSKPEPQYTEEARQHQTTGTVILRAVLGQDGKVHAVIPVKSLPYGLTGKCILVAHRIKFEPAMKDGHTVSVAVQLEYNFNLTET